MSNLGYEVFVRVAPWIVIAGGLSIALEALKNHLERRIRERRGETTAERIQKLSKALTDATALIGGIEKELVDRHRLVEKLRADCDRYEELAKLKSSEVEAVVQSLRGEIRQEGKKSFWQSVGLNVLFFLAGVLANHFTA